MAFPIKGKVFGRPERRKGEGWQLELLLEVVVLVIFIPEVWRLEMDSYHLTFSAS